VGPFYPPKIKASEMLGYYAREFSAVEIDSSYYGVPTVQTVESMAARTPESFRFSFKVPQTVTHTPDPGASIHDDAGVFCASLQPMLKARKLACVLAQFPNAFKPETHGRDYLRRVADALAGLPLVVEFRNRRWQQPETLELLHRLGIGYCNADMPALEGLLAPSADVTSNVGYVRFHGRNARQWWRGSNVTRYDYEYTPQELVPWTDRIAEIDDRASATYVFFNNHANGRAPRNAEMLAAMLAERYGVRADNAIAKGRGEAPLQTALPGIGSEDVS
jgi:uncharacterized protein YecE (DUF72 family)